MDEIATFDRVVNIECKIKAPTARRKIRDVIFHLIIGLINLHILKCVQNV